MRVGTYVIVLVGGIRGDLHRFVAPHRGPARCAAAERRQPTDAFAQAGHRLIQHAPPPPHSSKQHLQNSYSCIDDTIHFSLIHPILKQNWVDFSPTNIDDGDEIRATEGVPG